MGKRADHAIVDDTLLVLAQLGQQARILVAVPRGTEQDVSLYNLPHRDVRGRLYPLLELPMLKMPNKELCLAALDVFAQSEKVDFADERSVAYIRAAHSDGIYSYDVDFDKIAGTNRTKP